MVELTFYDFVQIGLLLLACWGCYRAGIERGATNVLNFLHEEGIIKLEDEE